MFCIKAGTCANKRKPFFFYFIDDKFCFDANSLLEIWAPAGISANSSH